MAIEIRWLRLGFSVLGFWGLGFRVRDFELSDYIRVEDVQGLEV